MDVIVTVGPGARAAQRATSTIPIVFTAITDPVGSGLVASLARPGGNVTGLTNFSEAIAGKRLELLKAAFPWVTRVADLWDPETVPNQIQATAPALGLQLRTVEARTADDLDRAFETAIAEGAQALIASPSPLFITHQRRIVELAARSRLPAMYVSRDFVVSGGLMSYASSNFANFRRAATYVDKILKGSRPGDLPVEQPTEFDFAINLKTA